MPPKGMKGLSKFAKQRTRWNDEDDSKESSKQMTISKFFAFSRNASDNSDRDVEIIVDETDSGKRRIYEEKVSSPLRKKARYSDQNATAEFNKICGEPVEKYISSSDVICRVKDKLKLFEASEWTETTKQDKNTFNFDILKRDRLSHLPDINLHENIQIPGSSSSTEICNDDEQDRQPAAAVNDDIKDLDKFSHGKGKGKSRTDTYSKRREPLVKVKFTQLEQQVIEIKKKYPEVVLFVECGYRFRFFGKDAEIASSVLKIFSHQDHNFLTASIPTHRLFVHVRRIVSAGYKVGVVKQTETAAIKAAGSNKNAPFTRELSALYTKSTLIGEDTNTDGEGSFTSESSLSSTSTYLVCISDHVMENNSQRNQIGLVAVQPSTGDIIYDSFEDDKSCSELETRLAHIQPVEILVSENAAESTCKLLRNLSTVSYNEEDKMRVERMEDSVFHYNNAVKTVSKFYQEWGNTSGLDAKVLQEILNLPKPVLCCLSALITYLIDFKLDKILTEFSNFRQFSLKSRFLQLNRDCLKNLEVFQNSTNGKENGSLFWALNQTLTRPGARLLKTWLSQPLLCHMDIISRQAAISDILNDKLRDIPRLKGMLGRLPDLEKSLLGVYHKKCSSSQVYMMLKHLETLKDEFHVQQQLVEEEDHVTSHLLRDIVSEIPDLLETVKEYRAVLCEKAAMENDKTKLFADESHFPAVVRCKSEIEDVCKEIQSHRKEVRLTIRQPSLEYTTVLGTEYLIEVKNQHVSLVPDDWVKISSTKAVSRFHSPVIVEKYARLQQLREQLVIECDNAWLQYLQELSEHYQRLKKAIQLISTLDCLLSLATVAQMHGYVRPEIVEDSICVEITEGRHPVIQEMIGQNKQYVPNDTALNAADQRVMIITGPNMGGKSCYIKQVALLTILAQIGSYVPAQSAKFGIFDAIYTRMGAEDQIYKGQSTFMVELSEVSNIMMKATSRSLVILDELGRGTSTHDGVAIAYATLDFFINQPKCLTMFVTHYPLLAEFEDKYPEVVRNYHMSFLLHDLQEDGCEDKITFLYQLVSGMAAKSYGLNVACLANVPSEIVENASRKSREMEDAVQKKRQLFEQFQRLFRSDKYNLRSILKLLKEGT